MRDMGTEMTPIPSQEPSRSATPVSATTPLRSPTSSIPSTPRRGEPTPTPTERSISNSTQNLTENPKKELSEQEQKLKTRREIVALGVQLGKMNIAAWASKDEKEKNNSGKGALDEDELAQIEYAKRADAWEEAEKSKHTARFTFEADACSCILKLLKLSFCYRVQLLTCIKSDFRFKREEIRIQAWESQQKARLEAEMRKIEVRRVASYA